MKIITCASFYGSGSSALTDLVAEYNNVQDLTEYEFRFLHDLDGISDLEFHLVECHNRHNSGHALKRFLRLSRFNAGTWFNKRYEPYFGYEYLKLTHEYIDRLIDFRYKGWWFYDLYDKGVFYYYLSQLINRVYQRIPGCKARILKNEETLCSHPTESEFLNITRDYIAKLLRAANPSNKEYLEVDQIVPSQNINRVLRYFSDDIYVFVVQRDPRDVYTLAKFIWKEDVCPRHDVDLFCKWFRYTYTSGKMEITDPKKVMKIKFEDLIYHYDDMLKSIEQFTGLESAEHVNKFRKFNPQRSKANTMTWVGKGIEEDIATIEKQLSEYLYPYYEVDQSKVVGIKSSQQSEF